MIVTLLAAPGGHFFPMAFADENEGDETPYPHGDYEADCAMCHGPEGWVPAVISDSFDHSEFGFGLDGAHNSTPCQSCHVSLEFNQAASECAACHQDIHRGELGNDCAACHTTRNFIDRPAEVRAHRMTRFPLTGAHATVDCDSCHTLARGGRAFVNTPVECEACHLNDFMATTEPNHAQAGFGQNCESCHSVFTWQGAELAGFDHSTTGFPLTGAHVGAPCTNCHTSGTFGTIASDCNSCHATDYQQAPGHVSGNFSLACEDCHSTLTWGGASINHDFFPFVGGHSGLDCAQCHTSGTTGSIPSDCNSCHTADYQQAPSHVSSGFPTTCENCHTITTWTNPTFDHGFFPLTGGHNAASCIDCHTSGTYGVIASDCNSCHTADYQQAPGHVSSGFPTTCEECHTIATWDNAAFDHDFFPLTGGHNAASCIDCHTNGTFGVVASDCNSCHAADYQQAPGHVSSGFPTTCEDCHTVAAWPDATFAHNFFPLTGGHNSVSCLQCHTTGTFGPMPSDCFFCHMSDYQQAPGHVSSGFPTTCEECHTVAAWPDATFAHDVFPLNGGHNGVSCVQCHTTGIFGTIPADCYSCHQADYETALDHVSLGFPTDCESCHNASNWQNVDFNHSPFDINGGPHDKPCASCHDQGTTSTFSCYGTCHKHKQSSMDDKHSEVSGYAYDFPLCFACHPTGND